MINVSHSKIERRLSCPLGFYFDYIAHTPEEPQLHDYAKTGKLVHNTIEDSLKRLGAIPIENILDEIETLTQTSFESYVKEWRPNEKEQNNSIECLDNFVEFMQRRYSFLERNDLLDNFHPTIIEDMLNHQVSPTINYRGVIDVGFVDTQGWFMDWKTSSSTKIGITEVSQATRYILLILAKEGITTFNDIPPGYDEFYIVNLHKKVNLNKCKVKVTPDMLTHEIVTILDTGMFLEQAYANSHFQRHIKQKNYANCLFCRHKLKCAAHD